MRLPNGYPTGAAAASYPAVPFRTPSLPGTPLVPEYIPPRRGANDNFPKPKTPANDNRPPKGGGPFKGKARGRIPLWTWYTYGRALWDFVEPFFDSPRNWKLTGWTQTQFCGGTPGEFYYPGNQLTCGNTGFINTYRNFFGQTTSFWLIQFLQYHTVSGTIDLGPKHASYRILKAGYNSAVNTPRRYGPSYPDPSPRVWPEPYTQVAPHLIPPGLSPRPNAPRPIPWVALPSRPLEVWPEASTWGYTLSDPAVEPGSPPIVNRGKPSRRPATGKGIDISPGGSIRPSPNVSGHDLRKPSRGEREKKGGIVSSRFGRWFLAAMSGSTEINDFLEVMWNALPWEVRSNKDYDGRNPFDIIRAFTENFSEVSLDDFVTGFIMNEMEDRLAGKAFGARQKSQQKHSPIEDFMATNRAEQWAKKAAEQALLTKPPKKRMTQAELTQWWASLSPAEREFRKKRAKVRRTARAVRRAVDSLGSVPHER